MWPINAPKTAWWAGVDRSLHLKVLAETAWGKAADELLWPSRSGGYLGPPVTVKSWLSGAVARCRKADSNFVG
jgi:hypothetical protein